MAEQMEDDVVDNDVIGLATSVEETSFNPWIQTGWMTGREVNAAVNNDPKYFKHVKINASAAAKMLEHANHGVMKGRKRSGMPIEIAGLLIGKIRRETFVVFDTLPLPVEGTEAQVVANDPAAIEHPIRAMELFERKGYNFIGWYHSHPFDLQDTPHWFMSGIDCQSQTMFQAGYNQAWVAIVIDPIRSLHRKTLECGSFFCYPPQYNPPNPNEGPDGLISDQDTIQNRWGQAYKRYYVLESDFFMSQTVQKNLRPVFDDWKQCFGQELRRNEQEEVYDISRLKTLQSSLEGSKVFNSKSSRGEGMAVARSLNSRICQYECRCRGYAQMIKHLIFNVDFDAENQMCPEV